jgi:threonine dehydrogenase-like Zn-dependent dehydrogenase
MYASMLMYVCICAVEKNLHVSGGQLFCQKYWKDIMQWMVDGKVDISWIVTHRMPLSKAKEAYAIFDKKEDNVLKILLTPDNLGPASGSGSKAAVRQ